MPMAMAVPLYQAESPTQEFLCLKAREYDDRHNNSRRAQDRLGLVGVAQFSLGLGAGSIPLKWMGLVGWMFPPLRFRFELPTCPRDATHP